MSATDMHDRCSPLFIPELLGHIFSFCLPQDDLPDVTTGAAPRLFSHICRTWRTIAFSTPNLWNRFTILPGRSKRDCGGELFFDENYARSQYENLRDWLKRSGELPLSFRFSSKDVEYTSHELMAHTLALVQLTVEHSHRWKDVDVSAPMTSFLPLFRVLNRNTPLMESLRLDYSHLTESLMYVGELYESGTSFEGRDWDDDEFQLEFSNTPKLKTLTVLSTGEQWVCRTTIKNIPHGLTDMRLTNAELLLCDLPRATEVTTLQCSSDGAELSLFWTSLPLIFPKLQELTLNSTGTRGTGAINTSPSETVTLTDLRTLRIGDRDGSAYFMLTCPKLESLTVSFDNSTFDGMGDRASLHIRRFLDRSKVSLKSFTLNSCTGGAVRQEELIALLKDMPLLEDLGVRSTPMDERLLDALTIPPRVQEEKPTFELDMEYLEESLRFAFMCAPHMQVENRVLGLCPLLHEIELETASGIDPDSAVRMIVSRTKQVREQRLNRQGMDETNVVKAEKLKKCSLAFNATHFGDVVPIMSDPLVEECIQLDGLKLFVNTASGWYY